MESRQIILAKNANRILFVRNLPFGIDGDKLYELFSRYGSIYQIRLGCIPSTSTTAFVVFDNVLDAQAAKDALNGYTIENRYLIVQYYRLNQANPSTQTGK
ncbi:hypothetical protein TVAG_424320 [Trichomonas vaginalis G3]|uniref:RRM domain-containing protein n=1 Tax=Trichomonas vaginalis (strain ATCC PRA-98 / G3) TaxID=412133 RepID=A2E1S1_TRIV3|nr:RNA splicing [Trichomonas vaginalis G3]EAY13400.1 hypothetical protein TVAG_424320 [Trichomonas vaginalis G3]KAI5528152.1 RNA splicing [Trichomonas vaginalis G3]|eukprot:XP_001325623.1 hypothetical protein [Trichomonas vaginalis G3]